MNLTELETAARNKYNAVGDTNWSSAEIRDLAYQACMELATECYVIENVYSTTTVSGTQEYAYPTYAIAIKRVTYNGGKLEPIGFRQDDALTMNNQALTSTGTSQYYAFWDNTLILRPIPDGAYTLKVYAYVEPQQITASTSTLEVPTRCHINLVDFIVSEMAAKDQNFNMAKWYRDRWDSYKIKEKILTRKRMRADGFSQVKDEESLPNTLLGAV